MIERLKKCLWPLIVAATLVLMAVPAFAGDNLGDRIVKGIDSLVPVLPYVGILAAWLIHSPFGSKLPKKVVSALNWLDTAELREIMTDIRDVSSGPDGRRDFAIRRAMTRTAGKPWALTESEASKLVGWLTNEYRAAKGDIEVVLEKAKK